MISSLLHLSDRFELCVILLLRDSLDLSVLLSVLEHFICLHMNFQGFWIVRVGSTGQLLLLVSGQSLLVFVLFFRQSHHFWLLRLAHVHPNHSLDSVTFRRRSELNLICSFEVLLEVLLLIFLLLLWTFHLPSAHLHLGPFLSEGFLLCLQHDLLLEDFELPVVAVI